MPYICAKHKTEAKVQRTVVGILVICAECEKTAAKIPVLTEKKVNLGDKYPYGPQAYINN